MEHTFEKIMLSTTYNGFNGGGEWNMVTLWKAWGASNPNTNVYATALNTAIEYVNFAHEPDGGIETDPLCKISIPQSRFYSTY